jgi:hypothetical protein
MGNKVHPRGNPALAIGYIRVSDDAPLLTEIAQRNAIEAWAQREGVSVAGWRIDRGDGLGPELNAAFTDLPAAGAGWLVAASAGRVADRPVLGGIEAAANSCGARLVCADGSNAASGEQRCPICGFAMPVWPRYPRMLCGLCEYEAQDEEGRALRFYNVDSTGGFRAEYADTGQQRAGHICYVRGVKCLADEAHFGGIVIQPVDGAGDRRCGSVSARPNKPSRRRMARISESPLQCWCT